MWQEDEELVDGDNFRWGVLNRELSQLRIEDYKLHLIKSEVLIMVFVGRTREGPRESFSDSDINPESFLYNFYEQELFLVPKGKKIIFTNLLPHKFVSVVFFFFFVSRRTPRRWFLWCP